MWFQQLGGVSTRVRGSRETLAIVEPRILDKTRSVSPPAKVTYFRMKYIRGNALVVSVGRRRPGWGVGGESVVCVLPRAVPWRLTCRRKTRSSPFRFFQASKAPTYPRLLAAVPLCGFCRVRDLTLGCEVESRSGGEPPFFASLRCILPF